MVRESEHLRFLRDLLFKILAGIVSLPRAGAVASARRFAVQNKGNEEGNEWREKAPLLCLLRYLLSKICAFIYHHETPPVLHVSNGMYGTMMPIALPGRGM
jgi:hypothetical protein